MKSERSRSGYYGVVKQRFSDRFIAEFAHEGISYKKLFDAAEDAAAWIDLKLEELGITELVKNRLERYGSIKRPARPKKRKERENKLGHEGLKYEKDRKCWAARIRRNGKEYKVRAKTKEEALKKLEELKAKYPTKAELAPPKLPKPPKPKKEPRPLQTQEEYKEKQRARYKQDLENNRRKAREYSAKIREENPGHVKALRRKHYEANKELYVAKSAARRAKTKKPPIWCPEANKVYARMRREAKKLEELTAIVFEVDHIVPLNAGTTPLYGCTPLASGLHCTDNFQLLTQLDNNRKLSYTWPDMWDYDDADLLELQRTYETTIKHVAG